MTTKKGNTMIKITPQVILLLEKNFPEILHELPFLQDHFDTLCSLMDDSHREGLHYYVIGYRDAYGNLTWKVLDLIEFIDEYKIEDYKTITALAVNHFTPVK